MSGFNTLLKNGLVSSLSQPERNVIDRFGAQIGELAWHLTHVDASMSDISQKHADQMCRLASEYGLNKPLILEVGAYAHYSALLAATRLSGQAWTHDISPDSLRLGKQLARDIGLVDEVDSVAGDFHDLPFEDNMFDIVFIASAVHHTWQPGKVMAELGRVARPGGIVHLENEPVGRMACLYEFRGNRAGDRTAFENDIETRGLTHTITSPFPGSRAEALFGIIENDRIPLEIYNYALSAIGEVRRFELDTGAHVNDFENWLLEKRPAAPEIAARLIEGVAGASAHFAREDVACKLAIPTPDVLWPLAYRISDALKQIDHEDKMQVANLFGAALRATVVKRDPGRQSAASARDLSSRIGAALRATVNNLGAGHQAPVYRRDLSMEGQVLIDDEAARKVGLSLIDCALDPVSGEFGQDWLAVLEENGNHTICSLKSDCELLFRQSTGVLAVRFYSVFQGEEYFLSITKNGQICYRHHVARSESHMAMVFVSPGDQLSVHMHHDDGTPFDMLWGTRILVKQVRLEAG